jgi:hypothetical protein
MERKILQQIDFTQAGDFAAVNAAERWCRENGYSVGDMQRGDPRGILKGEWAIAKWRNLTARHRAELDGIMVGGRDGPVTITIWEGGKGAEMEANCAALEANWTDKEPSHDR